MRDDELKKDGAENQLKGLGKQAEGKTRHAVGDITGDRSEQLKGRAKDVAGKVQRKFGEVQSDAGDDTDRR
jgi:uncharacterized protein YjbJ (UPF0337 family)